MSYAKTIGIIMMGGIFFIIFRGELFPTYNYLECRQFLTDRGWVRQTRFLGEIGCGLFAW